VNTGASLTCSQTASWTAPSATDNCAIASLTFTTAPTAGLTNGGLYPVGVTTVTYLATDVNGNTQTCSFTITVVDNTKPTINGCPGNQTVNTGPAAVACAATASWTAPTATDNCAVASLTFATSPIAGLTNGGSYPVGVTTVTYTATDVNGNTQTCSFTITVVDNTPPVFSSCPSPIINAPVNTAGCVATITTTNPVVADNCLLSTLTWTLTGATTASSPGTGINFVGTRIFNVGTTTVTYKATDGAGNSSSCTFTVSVVNTLAGGISGTKAVVQNVNTTSNITFTGSGGTKPYTFTYNVNGGANQTISTTGANSLTTVPQSNAVLGQFIYTLVSVTDANGCSGTLPVDNKDTITVVTSLPDFTPLIDIDALSFAATGTSRDFVVDISEVQNSPSVGQVVFRIVKPTAFTITFGAVNGVSNVSGGEPNNNGDWTITQTASVITCTLKPGVVINGFGTSVVGFNITRNAGIPANTTQNITVAITNNSGGDSNSANNSTNTSVTCN